ncbi:glycosyltransferase family 2 protein [Frankia sp. Ag45/Mut15]|uniref:Glycosyltransferase family 2 protein n=1 Tax=Frankia umida TaxID=573489 RepID=A0ABT0K4R5_9ACTN|nr:glycosyltransferase family 2 protein [Frankia umida]MCK9878789.1 glycosyltransferase family 2 protein [Frankia umida]
MNSPPPVGLPPPGAPPSTVAVVAVVVIAADRAEATRSIPLAAPLALPGASALPGPVPVPVPRRPSGAARRLDDQVLDQAVDLRVVEVHLGAQAPAASSAASSSAHLVLCLPAGTPLGAAVAAALDLAGGPPPGGFVWLLDQHTVPAADTLRTLLAYARVDPGAAVLGPKLRRGVAAPRLLEVGASVDRAGRRHTGIRACTPDHGQHDGVRDVLAVSWRGLLARSWAWRRLDGLDPTLAAAHDLDLGWRAARAGLRTVVVPMAVLTEPISQPGRLDPGRAERVAALRIGLAHTALPLLAPAVLALLGMTLLRALRLLARGRGRLAARELALPALVLGRPGAVLRLRRRAARTRTVPQRAVRSLFPRGLVHPARPLRRSTHQEPPPPTPRPPAPSIPAPRAPAPPAWAAPLAAPDRPGPRAASPSAVSRPTATRPAPLRRTGASGGASGAPVVVVADASGGRSVAVLVVSLAAVGLVAMRAMPVDALGAGLPMPADVGELWSAVWSGRLPGPDGLVGPLDGGQPVPPIVALIAAVASVLGGRVTAASWLLLALGPALAGWSAHRALGRLEWTPGQSRPLVRCALAAGYALNPALTAAVLAGRVDTVGALVALPLVLAHADAVLRGPVGPGEPHWARPRAALALAVSLTALVACAPPLAAPAWVVLVACVLLVRPARLPDVAVALAGSVIPLIPLLPAGAWSTPVTSLAAVPRPALGLLAGAGTRPTSVYLGLLAGCLFCWLIGRWHATPTARRSATTGWCLLLLGMAAMLITPRLAAGRRVGAAQAWWAAPQYGLVLAAALLAAAALALDPQRPCRGRIARPTAVAMTTLILATPVALAADRLVSGTRWRGSPASWLRATAGVDDSTAAAAAAAGTDPDQDASSGSSASGALAAWSGTAGRAGEDSSAVARAILARIRTEPRGSRLLLLDRSERSGLVRYALATASGERYPAGLVGPPRPAADFVASVVTGLTSGSDRAGGWLPLLAVAAVGVPTADASATLVDRLDESPALVRDRPRPGLLLWRPASGPVAPARPGAPPTTPAAYIVDAAAPSSDANASGSDAAASGSGSAGRAAGGEALMAAPRSARLLPADGALPARAAVPSPRAGSTRAGSTRAGSTRAGSAGDDGARELVLATPAGNGWRAFADGRPLSRFTAWGWAAGFHLPADLPAGSQVRVERDDTAAHLRALVQIGALGLLLLALAGVGLRSRLIGRSR